MTLTLTVTVTVTAGFYHWMYVKTDGTLWGTGYNKQGQLGIDSEKDWKYGFEKVEMVAG